MLEIVTLQAFPVPFEPLLGHVYDVEVPISKKHAWDSVWGYVRQYLHSIPVPFEPSLGHVYDVQVPISGKHT